MLFSVSYKSKHKQEAEEIRCPVNQLGLIFEFIKNNPTKRYNIAVDASAQLEKVIEQIDYVKAVADDYTIECGDIPTFRSFKDAGYNAYLRFPITDWETVSYLIKAGASDIYIDGPLGFQRDAFIRLKQNSDVKIRVSPTVSPNASLSGLDDTNVSTFFIRPEDLKAYRDFVDVVDFKIGDQDKEDTLFTIYKRGTFNFDLKELIEALNVSVPNLFIPSDFTKARLNCGQRCKNPNKNCHLCDTQLSLTNTVLNYFE